MNKDVTLFCFVLCKTTSGRQRIPRGICVSVFLPISEVAGRHRRLMNRWGRQYNRIVSKIQIHGPREASSRPDTFRDSMESFFFGLFSEENRCKSFFFFGGHRRHSLLKAQLESSDLGEPRLAQWTDAGPSCDAMTSIQVTKHRAFYWNTALLVPGDAS